MNNLVIWKCSKLQKHFKDNLSLVLVQETFYQLKGSKFNETTPTYITTQDLLHKKCNKFT